MFIRLSNYRLFAIMWWLELFIFKFCRYKILNVKIVFTTGIRRNPRASSVCPSANRGSCTISHRPITITYRATNSKLPRRPSWRPQRLSPPPRARWETTSPSDPPSRNTRHRLLRRSRKMETMKKKTPPVIIRVNRVLKTLHYCRTVNAKTTTRRPNRSRNRNLLARHPNFPERVRQIALRRPIGALRFPETEWRTIQIILQMAPLEEMSCRKLRSLKTRYPVLEIQILL